MNLPCYRKLIRFFLLTSLALALTGCGSRHNDRPSGLAAPESAFLEAGQAMDWNYDESASMSEKKSADLAGYTPDTPAAAEGSGIERMIIKNGTISIQVGDPAAASDQVRAIAAANQGYVVSGSVYKSRSEEHTSELQSR